ncbi:MAG: hypothetical protein O7G88_09195, partial [bacterium]|nr:hypothetical protein [bacterium]
LCMPKRCVMANVNDYSPLRGPARFVTILTPITACWMLLRGRCAAAEGVTPRCEWHAQSGP